MRVVSKILIIGIILTLILSSCLPLNFYPIKVCENNEQYIGVGIVGSAYVSIYDNEEINPFPHLTAYGRSGGPNNFDFGFEFGTFGLPGYFMFSGRKAFYLRPIKTYPYYSCECIVLDIGIGTSSIISPHYRMSVSYLNTPLSVTLGINENLTLGSIPSGSGSKSINSIYLKIAMEQSKKREVIPYFYISYQTHEEDQRLGMNFPSFFLSYTDSEKQGISKYISFGLGASFNLIY